MPAIKLQQVLPSIMIVLDVAAAIVYAIQHDTRRAIYWMAAAILTASVTL